MTLKTQKPIEFDNACGCLVNLDELKESILWYSQSPVISKKKIYMHGKYPAVSVGKEKLHVHRLLMMFKEKRKLKTVEFVHHIDENKLNATYENLTIVKPNDHASFHNIGKVLSSEHKSKISDANKRRRGIRLKKRRNIPNDELIKMVSGGQSINSIAKHYGVDWTTIRARIYENPERLEGEKRS